MVHAIVSPWTIDGMYEYAHGRVVSSILTYYPKLATSATMTMSTDLVQSPV